MIEQADPTLVFFIEFFFIAFVGLVLGSFTTALVYRVPRGIPWVFGSKEDMSGLRSSCPKCKTQLTAFDLVPVFSWLCSKGKCRHCKEPISKRYPLIEFGILLASVTAYFVLGWGLALFFVLSIIPFLGALVVIDIDEMILPNQLVLIIGVIGLSHAGYLAFSDPYTDTIWSLANYILGGLLYGGLSWILGWIVGKILKKDALGFGDVKFFTVAGIWLGIPDLALFCLVSGVLGIFFALGWQICTKQKVFPFGPALITALYLLLVFEGSLFL